MNNANARSNSMRSMSSCADDTNLSKETCFVLTGDPTARPGGSIDPVTNPEGLTSRCCSATFVAKVWFALN
jgi:hypothetical protein